MSTRYSISPTLHLAIAESRAYRRCQCLFYAAVMLALWELGRGGYLQQAILATPLILLYLQARWQQPFVGCVIHWRSGEWVLECGSERESIQLLRGHCLPWITFFTWRYESGVCGQAWLFNDSASREELRRLRVRLRLERGV